MKDKKKDEVTTDETTEASETADTEEAAKADEKNEAEAESDAGDVLKKEKEALEKQLAEEKDKYLRMAAEYDNFRRRSAKEREGVYNDAYADALKQIIPVIDNLERAVDFSGTSEDARKMADGVRMILSQFTEVLKKLGIEAFGEKGEAFDPNIHNAIMHEENEELGESVITEVFQKGYRRGDKIIRCAMVKVAN